MALIHCDFYSEVLGLSSSMYVILPQATCTQIGMGGKSTLKKHPVLYLLHGLSDDHTIWLRRTAIERYVSALDLAVVMPAVNRSFYTDMENGLKYWTFVSEELPALARSFFPLSEEREDTFVAGLSMGGYGAFKLALRHPERFAVAASLSGAVDADILHPDKISKEANVWQHNEYRNIFGSTPVEGTEHDLFHLVRQVAASNTPKPALYQCCGTEDFLYEHNIRFKRLCQSLPLDFTYEEESGVHEWGYWDKKIQRVLEWLPLRNR
jgi:putative tributyrin esterase